MKETLLMCDAGPLILLAKLDQLHLILNHRRFKPVMLQCVRDEVLRGPFAPGEEVTLQKLIQRIPCEEGPPPIEAVGGLSKSDRECLIWARDHKGAWLLADDRLLRRAAMVEGVSVLGFAGLLIDHVQSGNLPKQHAIDCLNQAVSQHGYRISIELYRAILDKLNEISP